jgi:hypothetical protein
MVVVCAGTTGYNATVDLRYLWMRQKRLQGSHFANAVQSNQMNQLALAGKLDPCLSQAFTYDEIPLAHDLMYRNKHPHGNMAVLVGATDFGQGATAPEPPLRCRTRPCPRAMPTRRRGSSRTRLIANCSRSDPAPPVGGISRQRAAYLHGGMPPASRALPARRGED